MAISNMAVCLILGVIISHLLRDEARVVMFCMTCSCFKSSGFDFGLFIGEAGFHCFRLRCFAVLVRPGTARLMATDIFVNSNKEVSKD